jgi:hypothetical protein
MSWLSNLATPNKSIHSFKIFNIAVVDVVGTLGVAWLWSRYYDVPLWKTSISLFGLGILAHRFFNIRTAVDEFLFR